MDTGASGTDNDPMRRMCFPLMLVVALIGACDGGEEEPDRASETTSPSPSVTVTVTETVTPTPSEPITACANEASVVSDPALRGPGRLNGDLDDDGLDEEISLAVDQSAEPGCQAFVVAENEEGVQVGTIAHPDIPFSLGFPRLISLTHIDGRPGAEIVVGVGAGASTQIAALFSGADRELSQIRLGSKPYDQSSFPFGGSVGLQSAVDCAAESGAGAIVVSTAIPIGTGKRFQVDRSFYLPTLEDDPSYQLADSERVKVRFDRFESLHEFPNSPFGSCPSGESG